MVSVVVPTYREADNLPLLVPQITAALQSWPHEIIIVDDDSNDGTDQVVATLSEQGHAVRLIVRTDQRGLSSAVLRGFFEAKGNVLVCMDADLSHPPEILPRMIETIEEDQAEFVIGSRYVSERRYRRSNGACFANSTAGRPHLWRDRFVALRIRYQAILPYHEQYLSARKRWIRSVTKLVWS